MTMICDKGFGGLEHTYSTALMYDRNTLVTPIGDNPPSEGYQSFLGLCSHEFLHTWHVKRNRPLELMNATLMEETYTEQLWIYEGFTSYYDDISLARCKLVQVDDYLRVLGENLTRLERNPGKDKQSVTESSFYTWNKFYKQNEGSINHIVSYYTKGAIIALCLDLKMRQASNGKFSLDHLMQQLWRQYGSQNIGTLPNVIDTLLREEFALDFSNFIEEATTTTQPLPVEELLATVGVELNRRPAASLTDKGGKSIKACLKNEFGASLKKSSLGASVTKVIENTPAYHAGIQVNDHLIALNQWQIDADSFSQHLDRCSPGEEIQLTLLRDKKLKQCVMQVQAAPHDTIYLVVKEKDKVNQWMGL
jgi:predicted metalloprotease with PDZ domain